MSKREMDTSKPTRTLTNTERPHIQLFSVKILVHSSISNRRVRANAHISRIKLKFKLLSISLVPKGNSTSILASTSFPWTILVGQQYASTTLGKRFVFWQGFHLCSFICICYYLLFDDIGNWWVKKSKRKGGINFYLNMPTKTCWDTTFSGSLAKKKIYIQKHAQRERAVQFVRLQHKTTAYYIPIRQYPSLQTCLH